MKQRKTILTASFIILFLCCIAQSQLNIDSLSYRDIQTKTLEIKPEDRSSYGNKTITEYQSLDSLEWLSKWELYHLFADNATYFYSFDLQYTTPLQLKAFEASPEYAVLVDSMKNYKQRCKKQIFRISIADFNRIQHIPEYSLQKHGFVFTLKRDGDLWDKPLNARTIESRLLALFDISRLPLSREDVGKMNESAYFTIPVPESKALEIEKLDYQCEMWLLFDFKNYSKIPYQYNDKSGKTHSGAYSMIVPKSIRAVFIDTQNESIIYSATFKIQ